jgi:dipeptidyl aminopeptidase/acylaminoacyl peptidase
VAGVAPAWRPGPRFQLAFVDDAQRVVLVNAESGRVLWRERPDGRVAELEWSSDGRRLVARRERARDDVAVYTPTGSLATGVRIPRGEVTAVSIRPGSHAQAVAMTEGPRSRLFSTSGGGTLLSGPGTFESLEWSPDGRWLVVSWRAADQWVFVRSDGTGIRAVSDISEQFRSRSFPRVEGWCCTRG